MSIKDTSEQTAQKLGKTLKEDLRHGSDLKRSLKQDFRDLKEFYLDKEQKLRLERLGWFKRTFYMTIWFLKILFLKLSPIRRILLLIGIFLLFFSQPIVLNNRVEIQPNWFIGGIILILFILMLELKDKLLARDELEAGRKVQNALLPERSPRVPGWQIWLFSRPANEVGGDLIDFLSLGSKRYGIALGDIAGKGLGAALLTSKLQATLRAFLPDLRSLSILGSKLNKIFYRDAPSQSFASLVYLEISPHSGTVHLVNAGHMPPLLLRSGKIEELPKGESALGILPEENYREHRITLEKDNLLIVYSDGVTEARNQDGIFLGEKRFRAILMKLTEFSAHKTGENILKAVGQFVGDARPTDDISLAILKRTE